MLRLCTQIYVTDVVSEHENLDLIERQVSVLKCTKFEDAFVMFYLLPVSWFMFSVLLLAISVILFGVMSNKDYEAAVLLEQGTFVPVFGWSFWVAAGATGMAFISSTLYFFVGRKENNYY